MRRVSMVLTSLLMLFLLQSCIPDEGNPDLSGSWTCTETSEIFMKTLKGTSVYPVRFIGDVNNPDRYQIENFYKLGNGVKVMVEVSGYTITIPRQTAGGFEFVGQGSISGNYALIELEYTADDSGGEIDHVTATYAR